MGNLYLIPSPIAENATDDISPRTIRVISQLDHFIVERARTTRRFIRSILPDYDLNKAVLVQIDKHSIEVTSEIKSLFETDKDIGLLSEAGSPCIADPGEGIVTYARSLNYSIIPLSGPNSILLALMASGLNAEHFCFHGYLPIKETQLKNRIESIQSSLRRNGYTQIAIETPYRTQRTLDVLVKVLNPNLRLCLAQNIGSTEEYIVCDKVSSWTIHRDKVQNVPSVFLIGK